MISQIFGLSQEIMKLINACRESCFQKVAKKEEKNEMLKKIVLFQRSLKSLKAGEYNGMDVIEVENQIADIIKSKIDEKLSDIFVSSAQNLYWTLRNQGQILDYMVEDSLEKFIQNSNELKYSIT